MLSITLFLIHIWNINAFNWFVYKSVYTRPWRNKTNARVLLIFVFMSLYRMCLESRSAFCIYICYSLGVWTNYLSRISAITAYYLLMSKAFGFWLIRSCSMDMSLPRRACVIVYCIMRLYKQMDLKQRSIKFETQV